MAESLHLSSRHREEIEALLHKHLPGVEVWAYGSRVNGRSHDGSDLDLVLRSPKLAEIDISRLADFIEALQDSTIPFLVEARDWARLPESFHCEIKRAHVVLAAGDDERFAGRSSGVVGETIADFVDIVMGQSPPGGTVSGGVGLPLLNGPTEFGPHHPTPIQFTTDARKIAHPGDLLFCVRGSTTGRMNWADQEYAIGRGVAAIRHRCASELQPFVRAVIEFELPELLVQATGSTFPNVSASQLSSIPYPSLSATEQRAIAHILGTLDDKIELNRRMNETLEALALTLFKSWFVDFEPVRAKMAGRDTGLPQHLADLFPDRLVDSELGKIPEGWEWATFGDVVEQFRENENPLASPDSIFRHFSIPAFDASQSPKAEFGQNIKSQKSHVPSGVVLLSKLNPEIERVWFVDVQPDERAVCSTEFLVLRPRPPYGQPYAYCLARSPAFRQELEGLVTGTSKSHQRAQVAAILSLNVVKPADALATSFERAARPLLQRTLECRRESCTLAETRDTLLPKLVSGELAVERMQSGSSERPNHDDSPASFRQYGTNRRKLKTAQ